MEFITIMNENGSQAKSLAVLVDLGNIERHFLIKKHI